MYMYVVKMRCNCENFVSIFVVMCYWYTFIKCVYRKTNQRNEHKIYGITDTYSTDVSLPKIRDFLCIVIRIFA